MFLSSAPKLLLSDILLQVNGKIKELDLKLQQTREDLHTKNGELAVKNSKLADTEIEVKLLQLRKAILAAQKKDLIETKNKTSENYVRKGRKYSLTTIRLFSYNTYSHPLTLR